MRYIGQLSLVFGLILLGSNYKNNSIALVVNSAEVKESSIYSKDSVKIQTLIRQMLKWAISNRTFKLLPTLSKDSFCVGFDPEG